MLYPFCSASEVAKQKTLSNFVEQEMFLTISLLLFILQMKALAEYNNYFILPAPPKANFDEPNIKS